MVFFHDDNRLIEKYLVEFGRDEFSILVTFAEFQFGCVYGEMDCHLTER